MRNASRAILIIGLVFGLLGRFSQLYFVVSGDTIKESLKKLEASGQQVPNYDLAMANMDKMTDPSLAHILTILGAAACVIAGAVCGLIGGINPPMKVRGGVFGGLAVALGLGLLAFHAWVAAAAYVVGGFLVFLWGSREPENTERADKPA